MLYPLIIINNLYMVAMLVKVELNAMLLLKRCAPLTKIYECFAVRSSEGTFARGEGGGVIRARGRDVMHVRHKVDSPPVHHFEMGLDVYPTLSYAIEFSSLPRFGKVGCITS
jgi:hypothetical protein